MYLQIEALYLSCVSFEQECAEIFLFKMKATIARAIDDQQNKFRHFNHFLPYQRIQILLSNVPSNASGFWSPIPYGLLWAYFLVMASLIFDGLIRNRLIVALIFIVISNESPTILGSFALNGSLNLPVINKGPFFMEWVSHRKQDLCYSNNGPSKPLSGAQRKRFTTPD